MTTDKFRLLCVQPRDRGAVQCSAPVLFLRAGQGERGIAMKTTMKTMLAVGVATLAALPAAAQTTSDRTWTGPYIGGQLGYAFQPKDNDEVISFDRNQDGTFGDQVNNAAGANAFAPGFCGSEPTSRAPGTGCRGDRDSVNWRVHAGYDVQMGNLVFGGVAEFGRTHTLNDAVTAFSTTPAFYTMSREYRYGGNLRARAGFALGDTLLYGTGGGSWASVYKRYASSNTTNIASFDRRDNAYGWNAGGGIEQRVSDRFSIGMLYLFTGLNDKNRDLQLAGGPTTAPFTPFTNTATGGSAAGTTFRRTGKWFYHSAVNVTASFRF